MNMNILNARIPNFLKFIQEFTYNFCIGQDKKDPPRRGPGTWSRQAFELSLFRIFSPEAAKNLDLKIGEEEFARLQFPFGGVEGAISESK